MCCTKFSFRMTVCVGWMRNGCTCAGSCFKISDGVMVPSWKLAGLYCDYLSVFLWMKDFPSPSALVSSKRKWSDDNVCSVKQLLFLQPWVKVCFIAKFHWSQLEFCLSKVLKIFLQVTLQLLKMENWESRDIPNTILCFHSCCMNILIWRLSRSFSQKCMLTLNADKDVGAVVLLELQLFIQLSTMAGVFLLNI